MKTYNFYERKDLEKFLKVLSYGLKDKIHLFNKLLEQRIEDLNWQKELTDMVNKCRMVNEVKLDILSQIEEKEKSILTWQKQIDELKMLDVNIKDCETFKDIFNSIVSSVLE